MVSIANQNRKKRSIKCNKSQSNFEAFIALLLPWMPSLSPKLKKIGCRIVFKSNPNLRSLLKCKSKSKFPHHSNCSKRYIGETKLQIRTRTQLSKTQSFKKFKQGQRLSACNSHLSKFCTGVLNWEKAKTL